MNDDLILKAVLAGVIIGCIVVIGLVFINMTPDTYNVPDLLSNAIVACDTKNGTGGMTVDRFVACMVDSGFGFTYNGDVIRIEPK